MRTRRARLLVLASVICVLLVLALAPPALAETYSLSGTVTDDAGQPLVGVWAQVRDAYGNYLSGDSTDEFGVYVVEGLSPHFYDVRATREGYAEAQLIDLDLRLGSISNADLVLIRYRYVSGTVTDMSGVPIGGGWTRLFTTTGGSLDGSSIAPDGTYRIRAVPGTYRARTEVAQFGFLDEWYGGLLCLGNEASAASPVVVADADVTGIDFELDMGRTVSGVVSGEAGGALSNIRVEVLEPDGDYVGSRYTLADGSYEITGLLHAIYKVRTSGASSQGYFDEWYDNLPTSAYTVSQASEVNVTAVGATDIDFDLTRGRAISGRITDETVAPLSGVYVQLYNDSGGQIRGTNSAADGTYSFTTLTPGRYKLRTSGAVSGFDEWFDDIPVLGYAFADASWIDVRATDATDTDLALRRAATISGTVVNEAGIRIANGQVELVDAVTGVQLRSDGLWDEGVFTFTQLEPGVYKLRTRVNNSGYLDEWYDNLYVAQHTHADATPVDVGTIDATGLVFTLAAPRTISGTVTNVVGAPATGVQVAAFTPLGQASGSRGTVDAEGHYTITGLVPGDYTVRTVGSGYLNLWYDGIPVSVSLIPPVGAALIPVTDVNASGINFQLSWNDWSPPNTSADGDLYRGFATSAHPVIYGTANDDCWVAKVEYSVDNGATWSDVQTFQRYADGKGASWQTQLGGTAGFADGEYRVIVRAVDGTGDLDPTPIDKRLVVDTVLPEFTWDAPADLASFLGQGLVVSGTAADPTSGVKTVLIRVENPLFGQKTYTVDLDADQDVYGWIYPGSVTWERPITLPYGESVITVLVGDAAGNQTAWSAPRTVTALAGPGVFTVSAAVLGSGGTISPAVQSINDGESASVEVVAAPGYLLDWVKDGEVDVTSQLVDGAYTIGSVTANHHLTAAFQAIRFDLVLGVSGQGSIEPGLNEDDDGTGSLVDLTARPVLGWEFTGWSGDCTGADNPVTVLMDTDKSVEASFDLVFLAPELQTGWNLIAGSGGSDTDGYGVFAYVNGGYISVTADALQPGQGYWVKYPTPGMAALMVVDPPVSVHLVPGWNLVGNPTGVALKLPSGVSGFFYGPGGYVSTTLLQPGEGAWIKATAEGDIVLAP